MSQQSHLAAAAQGGVILQSQMPALLTSLLTTADSSTTTTTTAAPNAFMDLSLSKFGDGYRDSPLLAPLLLSLNSTSHMMMPGTLDPFSHSAPGAFANGSLGNAPAHTSATALLQKAAEIGSKISDSTIAPILLRGFSGYTTNNTEATLVDSNKDNHMTDSSIPIHHQQVGAGFLPAAAESIAGNRLLQGGPAEIFLGGG